MKTISLISGGLFVLVFDQAVKFFLLRSLESPGDYFSFLNWLRFEIVKNPGITFGIQIGKPWLLVGLIAVLVLFVILYFRYLRDSHWLVQLAVGFIWGGAISNIIDRLSMGGVIDFITMKGWPTFNIADIAIVLGVAVILVIVLFKPRLINLKNELDVIN